MYLVYSINIMLCYLFLKFCYSIKNDVESYKTGNFTTHY
jgi:hypothetical protein